MFKTIKEDIKNVFDRDPALKSNLEAFLCYPGLHAIWGHQSASSQTRPCWKNENPHGWCCFQLYRCRQ
ncbi:MAG: hypothetical protein EOM66_06710 [Clostridia bacterium]|nr:hypothetical protein [Clostridia bacterium]